MIVFTKQERLVLAFFAAALGAGLCLDLAFKEGLFRLPAFRILDDPSFYPRVNVNRATLDELVAVPHIGPATAGEIIARRPYQTLDDLRRVPGIGDSRLVRLRIYLKVR